MLVFAVRFFVESVNDVRPEAARQSSVTSLILDADFSVILNINIDVDFSLILLIEML